MAELNKSLDRAIAILKKIALEDAVGLRELSRITGTSLTATEKIVKTLEEHIFIEKDESEKIILGRELYFLGKLAEARMDSIQIIVQEIKDLVRDIDETVYLCQRRDKHTVFIEGVQSSHPIQYVPEMGKLYDLPYGATGYAFMAYMSEDEIKEIIDFYQVDPVKIFYKLSLIKEEKYAMSYQERFEGLVGIAFPLITKNGTASLVLDIAIPTYRYSGEKKDLIINRAKGTVNKLLNVIG